MYNNASRSVAEQTINNATSWIGHRNADNADVAAGQTFVAGTAGDLESIAIFSTLVTRPGNVIMTLYEFDEQQKQWGASLGSSTVAFTKDTHNKWVPFYLNGLHVNKGSSYGFKLESTDSYIGIGEAALSADSPLDPGTQNEWRFENNRQQPFRFFSLAYKVGLKAA